MRISFDHAHIFATNIDTTVDFFVRMFDAIVVWDEEAAGVRCARLMIGKGFVHVYAQPPRILRTGVVHHLGIETDDLEGLVSTMVSKGYVFRNPIREESKFKYVMIAGPDELLIELFECREPARWRLQDQSA